MTLRFGVFDTERQRFDEQRRRPHPDRLGGVALAGSPRAVHEHMQEHVETGANHSAGSFPWGDLTHEQAMRSIELFAAEVMPRYAAHPAPSRGASRGGPEAP